MNCNTLLNEKIMGIKVHQYLNNGQQKGYITGISEANIAIRKYKNKTYAICKRSDVALFLDHKIFVYKKDNTLSLLRKIGSPKRIANSNVIKVIVSEYSDKHNTILDAVKAKLLYKNIMSKDEVIFKE